VTLRRAHAYERRSGAKIFVESFTVFSTAKWVTNKTKVRLNIRRSVVLLQMSSLLATIGGSSIRAADLRHSVQPRRGGGRVSGYLS